MKIEWAFDIRGRQPAKQEFDKFPKAERERVQALLRQFEQGGQIANQEKFKRLQKTDELWEFKRFQTRLLGSFRPGDRFVISHVLTKKSDLLPKAAVKIAEAHLAAHDAYVADHKRRVASKVPAVAAQVTTPTPPPPEPPPPQAETKPTPPPVPLPPEPDYVWTYMRTRDVLPPDAPLLLNTCRPYRPERDAANLEVMKFYVQRRMAEMPPEVRMVVNVDDPRLMMGAILGLEFSTAWQESHKTVDLAPAQEVAKVVPKDELPTEDPVPLEGTGLPFETVWIGRQKKAPALAIVMSRFDKKVTVRQYTVASDAWSAPTIYPAARIIGPAKLDHYVRAGDKRVLVSVAVVKLREPMTVAPSGVKPVWVQRGGDKRGGKTLAVVLSNGGPNAYVTKFAADPRRWTARAKVPCARIIGPADPAEKVSTSHGILRVADAMALFH